MAKTTKSGSLRDIYSQSHFMTVTEAAANGGKATLFTTGFNIEDKEAILIHRIEYQLNGNELDSYLAADGDFILCGLAFTDAVNTYYEDPGKAGLIDYNQICRTDLGTAGTGLIHSGLIAVKDFNGFPGGGLPCHPASLYGWVKGVSCGAAISLNIIIHFTFAKWTDKMYEELYRIIQFRARF